MRKLLSDNWRDYFGNHLLCIGNQHSLYFERNDYYYIYVIRDFYCTAVSPSVIWINLKAVVPLWQSII